MEELDNKEVHTGTFDLFLQTLAILIFISLLIADKGMGLMKSPIPDIWYGTLGALGVGGVDFIKNIIAKRG